MHQHVDLWHSRKKEDAGTIPGNVTLIQRGSSYTCHWAPSGFSCCLNCMFIQPLMSIYNTKGWAYFFKKLHNAALRIRQLSICYFLDHYNGFPSTRRDFSANLWLFSSAGGLSLVVPLLLTLWVRSQEDDLWSGHICLGGCQWGSCLAQASGEGAGSSSLWSQKPFWETTMCLLFPWISNWEVTT